MKDSPSKTPVAMNKLKSLFVLAVILCLFSACSRGVGCPYATTINDTTPAVPIVDTAAEAPGITDSACRP